MIIVAGHLIVDPADRRTFLDGSNDVIVAARAAPGCHDFHLAADPLDTGRINVYERWEDTAAVEAFRGSGPSDSQQQLIIGADVTQFEIAGSISLT